MIVMKNLNCEVLELDIEEIKDFVYEVRTFGITSNDAKFVQITEYLLSELEKEKAKVERIKDKLTHLKILAKIENKDIDRIKELEILLEEE